MGEEAIDQQEKHDQIRTNASVEREQRLIIEIEIETIDRGVVKTQVMVTGYGSTTNQTRLHY